MARKLEGKANRKTGREQKSLHKRPAPGCCSLRYAAKTGAGILVDGQVCRPMPQAQGGKWRKKMEKCGHFLWPRWACQASTSSSRAWSPPLDTLVLRAVAPPCGACHLQSRLTRSPAFFVSCVFCAAWASKFARFPRKTCSRCLPCSEIRFQARKTSNSCRGTQSQPASCGSPPRCSPHNTSARRGSPT